MNTVRTSFAVLLGAGAVLLSSAGAFAAPLDPGPAFGQHVSECARTTGFSAVHNPGIHHGNSSGDEMSCNTHMG